MTTALLGYDTRFAIETNPASGVYVELDEVYSVTPPAAAVEQVKATHFKSPGRRHEYIPGITDSGSAKVEMNYIPASTSDNRLEALRAAGTTLNMRIIYPNGIIVTFGGFISSYEKDIPNEDKMTATVEITVTGNVTIAASAAPVNSVPPSIAGQAKVGQTLYARPGVYNVMGTLTYQWKANGTNIGGATADTYVPIAGQVGQAITLAETNTIGGLPTTTQSFATANVIA